MAIKNRSEVTIYETNGQDVPLGEHPKPTVLVESHWCRRGLVVLTVDGKKVTVAAADLSAAITNATNLGAGG